MGKKFSVRSIAVFLRVNRTEQTEFCIRTKVGSLLTSRRLAEIHVLMPPSNAEWDAGVDLILIGVDAIGVHDADEFVVAVRGLAVKQRRGLEGIEMASCRDS